MPLTDYLEKQTLDWLLGGAAATQPAGRWVSWATASPTSQSAFDGPWQSRGTVTFAAANSPQMSATNLNAPLATNTAAATAVGWNLWDRSVGGTRLAYGSCTAAIGCKSADQAQFPAGTLKITLA